VRAETEDPATTLATVEKASMSKCDHTALLSTRCLKCGVGAGALVFHAVTSAGLGPSIGAAPVSEFALQIARRDNRIQQLEEEIKRVRSLLVGEGV
jgi:hypothetical protein